MPTRHPHTKMTARSAAFWNLVFWDLEFFWDLGFWDLGFKTVPATSIKK